MSKILPPSCPFVKDNHTNQFAWFLSMEHQLFRCKTQAIVYLKTYASWMNPRRDKDSWKRYWTKQEAFSGPAVWHTCPIVHSQTWAAGPSLEMWLSNQQEKLWGRSSQPAPSQQYLNRLVHLLDKWEVLLASLPSLPGPLECFSWLFTKNAIGSQLPVDNAMWLIHSNNP